MRIVRLLSLPALMVFSLLGGAAVAQAADDPLITTGEYFGPRRRLYRLPHESRRRFVRRRPANGDAVRYDLFIQHYPRS